MCVCVCTFPALGRIFHLGRGVDVPEGVGQDVRGEVEEQPHGKDVKLHATERIRRKGSLKGRSFCRRTLRR